MSERSTYLSLAMFTAATIAFELLQTRLLSVLAWYHLAFFVIGLAMFGGTAGAIWVFLSQELFEQEHLGEHMGKYGLLFALAIVLSLALQSVLPVSDSIRLQSILAWFLISVCIAIPFFFAGIVICLALTRCPFPIGKLYAADLIGASCGCLIMVGLLLVADGPGAILWASVLAAAGALGFVGAGGVGASRHVATPSIILRHRYVITFLLAAMALFSQVSGWELRPLIVKGRMETGSGRPIYEQWNTFSRVAVFEEISRLPHLWGAAPKYTNNLHAVPRIDQLTVNIDGSAETRIYGPSVDLGNAAFLKWDVTQMAYHLPDVHNVAIIGAGGGRDILAARLFGVEEIVAIELNPILVDLLTRKEPFAEFSGFQRLDGVSFIADEGRSYLARIDKQFDIIQMALVDTWAATGAGAFTLSENGLYTVQGWQAIASRLSENGVLAVSRWYAPGNINETGRLLSLATATALGMGSSTPKEQIFLVTSGEIATLLFSRIPFTREQIEVIEAVAGKMHFEIQVHPTRPTWAPVLEQIVDAPSIGELQKYTSDLRLDLSPPTDDRPFFFNQLPFSSPEKMWKLAFSTYIPGVSAGNLKATATLILLIGIAALLVYGAILFPLRTTLQFLERRTAFLGSAYFLLIGAGFMLTEIALLQRLSVFLGHPSYSLVVGLFGIILATGLGSLFSERIQTIRVSTVALLSCMTASYILFIAYGIQGLLSQLAAWELPGRIATALCLIMPLGMLLGGFFPLGIRLMAREDSRPLPWFWGLNGAAGVLAASVAVATSIAFGISGTLLIAAACYLLVLPCGYRLVVFRSGGRTEETKALAS